LRVSSIIISSEVDRAVNQKILLAVADRRVDAGVTGGILSGSNSSL